MLDAPSLIPHRLTKGRYASGTRCPKLLWLETHESEAPELVGQAIPTVLLEQGRQVGALARARFGDGRIVGGGRPAAFALEEMAAETRRLMDQGARVLFEATFLTEDAAAVVDVLERTAGGWRLIEVKQSIALRGEQLVDVAFQLHVLARCGVEVESAVVMHLCPECVAPQLDGLFTTVDVTERARTLVPEIAGQVALLVDLLGGPCPEPEIDVPCLSPDACVFKPRCWSGVPEDHVTTLFKLSKKQAFAHHRDGRQRVVDLTLPAPTGKANVSSTQRIQRRQYDALRRGERVVERGSLGAALSSLVYPLAMLDFETVQLAVPVWPGCTPQTPVPVQFSVHLLDARSAPPRHLEWLAQGAADPRPRLATELVAACGGARTVMAYHAPFERGCLDRLAGWVPEQAEALRALLARTVDLLPFVRDHVYDPRFGGSFSIKKVLPALVPDLSYDGLRIARGDVASGELWRIMFDTTLDERARETTAEALRAYCRTDTLAMVRLLDVLYDLANGASESTP